MSLTSSGFFAFLLITLAAYYACERTQKYVLLLASLFFYAGIAKNSTVNLPVMIGFVILVTYTGAVLLEKTNGLLQKAILALCIGSFGSLLFITKYAYNVLQYVNLFLSRPADFSWLQFGAVAGVSYYILSAIGYLVDVYWKTCKAERNPAVVALFVSFFPQLVSGPITRFPQMGPQFRTPHALRFETVTGGMRRMLWGYFKKLVISERFAVIVQSVYGNYSEYSGAVIFCATLCYAVQLYTDFSGCMDIVLGTSQLFGITLPENFRAPFLSRSVQEFWQRWHITLGVWFKEYVMYPVQKSSGMIRLGKYCRKAFGKKSGKKVPFYLSMLILWFLLGIWHGGTAYYFVASAGIPFLLLTASDLLQGIPKKLNALLRINTGCESWQWFQRVRSTLLICICWVFVCAGSTVGGLRIIKHMLRVPVSLFSMDAAFQSFGLGVTDLLIMLAGLLLLFAEDTLIDQGSTLQAFMNRQNAVFRCLVIYLELICIALFGMAGTSAFIYFQF